MSQAQQRKAFNIITEGCGYLNRVREVPVKKGPSYLACTINALDGLDGDVEYVPFDLKIVGKQALEAIKMLRKALADKQKVFVGFRAGSPRPDFYEYEHKGEKKQVEGFKARLLQLTFALVNGEKFEIPLVERPTSGDVDGAHDGADHDDRLHDEDGGEEMAATPAPAPRRDRTPARVPAPQPAHH